MLLGRRPEWADIQSAWATVTELHENLVPDLWILGILPCWHFIEGA
jgi:hypothetical protein